MIKKYSMTITHDTETNSLNFSSECDGFNSLELLGLITWKQTDIVKQMNKEIQPDVVKRDVIVD